MLLMCLEYFQDSIISLFLLFLFLDAMLLKVSYLSAADINEHTV